MVHISVLHDEVCLAIMAHVFPKGLRVKVKMLSFTGFKASLSMKDMDQGIREDFNANRKRNVGTDGGTLTS